MRQVEIPFFNNSVKVSYTDEGLTEVRFQKKRVTRAVARDAMAKKIAQKLSAYLNNESSDLNLPVDWKKIAGTDFQKKVWKKMSKIPFGKVKTYGQLAKEVGSLQAALAVGSACGKNHLLLVIPCHRVVGTQGLGGFSGGGLPVKRKLHKIEAIEIR